MGESGLTEARDYLEGSPALKAALGLPEDRPIQVRAIGEGEHNRNYEFSAGDERYVLRVNVASQPFHANQVRYEFQALEALIPSGCTPLPLYLDDTPRALGKGCLVISYCEGPQLDFDDLRPGDLACAAQLMADVHSVAVPQSCALFRPADPLRTLFEECLERFEVYRRSAYEEPRLTRWMRRFIAAAHESMDRCASQPAEVHIINTEPLPSHFLIPRQAAERAAESVPVAAPGGFVDWERPILGEVAQDLAFFSCPAVTFWDSDLLFPRDGVREFNELYWQAVDGRISRTGFDERFEAWSQMTALRSATWCCRALTVYHEGSDAHQTAKTARKLPIYNSDGFLEMLAKDCFGL